MTAEISQISSDRVLAEHAAEIRRLGQRVIADIIEIGRHLTEAKVVAGHGRFGHWLLQEFDWSDRTARRFMCVYEMSLKSDTVTDLKLPMRELYLLAAPSTPEEARTEILERAAGGEQVSGAEVTETIARVKREKNGTPETDGTENAEAVDDAASSAEARKAAYVAAEHAEGDQAGNDRDANDHADGDRIGDNRPDRDHADEPEIGPTAAPIKSAPAPTEPAPDPATIAAAAVNLLSHAELPSFLDQLSPAHKCAFEQKFGARNSDNTNAEIATLARECSALLTHPEQHTDAIRKKLARIKKLTGSDGKARTKTAKSNAQLDHGAFAHGMGLAGQPGTRTVGIARVLDAAVAGGYRPPGAPEIDLSPIEPLVDESAVDPVVDESAVDPVVDESAAEPVVDESAVEPVAAAAPSDIVTNTRVETLVATFPADGSIPPFLRRVPS